MKQNITKNSLLVSDREIAEHLGKKLSTLQKLKDREPTTVEMLRFSIIVAKMLKSFQNE